MFLWNSIILLLKQFYHASTNCKAVKTFIAMIVPIVLYTLTLVSSRFLQFSGQLQLQRNTHNDMIQYCSD